MNKKIEISEEEHKNLLDTKAKWDKLGKEIAACYVEDNGGELPEDDENGANLCTIGEIAASAFGWL